MDDDIDGSESRNGFGRQDVYVDPSLLPSASSWSLGGSTRSTFVVDFNANVADVSSLSYGGTCGGRADGAVDSAAANSCDGDRHDS